MAYRPNLHADGEGVISIGSETWNIADGYTKIKILRLIIMLDLDEELAMFGRRDDLEVIDPKQIAEKRVEAVERMIFHLKQLIGNCMFTIEKGQDEYVVNKFLHRIEQVENVIDGISQVVINDVTKEDELRINERHLRRCVATLTEIKNELNFPLDRAGIIFKKSDELNIDEIMQDVEEGG